MFKYTVHTQKKIQGIFEELEYKVRYEKGNFNSGYCIVENKNIAVINKFIDTEAKINCLIDILANLKVDEKVLSEKNAEFYQKLMKSHAENREQTLFDQNK